MASEPAVRDKHFDDMVKAILHSANDDGATASPLLHEEASNLAHAVLGVRQACHDDAHQQASEWMQRAMDCRAEADALRAAVLDIDAHATPFGEDEDGWTNGGYIVSVGSLHRALGTIGHGAPRCQQCPHPHKKGQG